MIVDVGSRRNFGLVTANLPKPFALSTEARSP